MHTRPSELLPYRFILNHKDRLFFNFHAEYKKTDNPFVLVVYSAYQIKNEPYFNGGESIDLEEVYSLDYEEYVKEETDSYSWEMCGDKRLEIEVFRRPSGVQAYLNFYHWDDEITFRIGGFEQCLRYWQEYWDIIQHKSTFNSEIAKEAIIKGYFVAERNRL